MADIKYRQSLPPGCPNLEPWEYEGGSYRAAQSALGTTSDPQPGPVLVSDHDLTLNTRPSATSSVCDPADGRVGLCNKLARVTPKGTAVFDQIMASGFKPAEEDIVAAIWAMEPKKIAKFRDEEERDALINLIIHFDEVRKKFR